MRNSKNIAYFCMVILLMTTGCGHSDTDSDVSTVAEINFDDAIDTDTEENNSNNQGIKENVDNQQDIYEESTNEKSTNEESTNKQLNNAQSQSDSELDGNIESIADNSVVINKIFHPTENTSVSYIDDSEKVLITVYFSKETEFEVWTVKNNGVNGDADIEKQLGAFSDLKLDIHINMTGSYEGNDFHAKHVIIYNYV